MRDDWLNEPLDISGLWEAVANARARKRDWTGVHKAMDAADTRKVVEHWQREGWHNRSQLPREAAVVHMGRGWTDAQLPCKMP